MASPKGLKPIHDMKRESSGTNEVSLIKRKTPSSLLMAFSPKLVITVANGMGSPLKLSRN